MTSIKDKYDSIEIKTYAAYSDVAKELGMTVDQVSTVYEWYLKNTIEDIKQLPTVKVRLSGLGVLVFNPKKALTIIIKKIRSEYLLTQEPREDLTAVRGYTNYYMIGEWFRLFEERYERAKQKKLYTPAYVEYVDGDLERQKQNHKNLYESLQRVHGPEPEGVKELGQGLGGSNDQDSESI